MTLITDYFENINTKERAYWLGFIYADGCINPSRYTLAISTSVKDKDHIMKFYHTIGNESKIRYTKDNVIVIAVYKKKIIEDLQSHGCVQRKSKIIELPELDSRDLYLAFLLGYYDGDGKQGTTITSGSKKFLEQIKEMFQLPFRISEDILRSKKYGERTIIGSCYNLSLGKEIFQEMMDNYNESLQRKRKRFATQDEINEKIRKKYWDHHKNGLKFVITKEELEKLVWKMPSTKIARKFGVSGSAIVKRCKKLGIKKPPRGYWTKHK